jgi:pimeloyl-ACP methyl ester carboxylesterase
MRRVLVVALVGLASCVTNAQDPALEYGMTDARAVEVNGTTITYFEKGAGAPLLLVHGVFADFRYWGPVMAALAESHRVVAYSRRDFYPNPLDDTPSANRNADRDDLAALIERLGIAPVHLVGHSRGGHVALALAAARPGLVRSVTTIEGGFLDAGVSEEALTALASFGPVIRTALEHFNAGDAETGTRMFLEYALGRDSYQRWPESSKKIALQNARAFGRRPEAGLACAEVAAIRAPALLVIGADTPPQNRAMMRGVQTCVPGIETVEVEGASHNIHSDNPAAFSRAVLDFVGRH